MLTFHFVDYVFGEDDYSFQICFFNCGMQWNVRKQVQSKLNVVLRWGFLVQSTIISCKVLYTILLIYSFYFVYCVFKFFLLFIIFVYTQFKASKDREKHPQDWRGQIKFLNDKLIKQLCPVVSLIFMVLYALWWVW